MYEYTIKNMLDTLKKRLDGKNTMFIQTLQNYCYTAEFIFNKPATQKDINKFTLKTNWTIPSDYKDFLLLHNGATFFSHEYGDAFYFYSLEEIMNFYDKEIHKNCYPIGRYTDTGDIVINNSRCQKNSEKYMMLIGIEVVDFQCNFKTWLDRMIVAQGEKYWEWYSTIN